MGDSNTQTSTNMPFEPAIPAITTGLGDAQRIYQNGGFKVDPFQGDMVADFNQTQRNAFGDSRQAARANIGAIDGSVDAMQRAMDPSQRRQAIQNLQANVRADVMPAINGSFAGSGMTGSSLHAQNLAQGVSAGYADVQNQMYQQGENRAMQAAGMMPGLGQARLQQTDYLQDIGNQLQGQQQNEINARILRNQQRQGAGAAGIRDYLSLVGGVGGQFGTQSGTASSNPGLGSMLGFGLQAASLFSDRRLKTDIRRVGQTDDGLGVYTYRYKGDDIIQMGVMADEVERMNPAAVVEQSGFKTVDYGAIK